MSNFVRWIEFVILGIEIAWDLRWFGNWYGLGIGMVVNLVVYDSCDDLVSVILCFGLFSLGSFYSGWCMGRWLDGPICLGAGI